MPSTRRAAAILVVGAIAYLMATTSRTSLSATGLEASDRFGLTSSELASFGVLQICVYAACQIPVGVLIDRYGARALMLSGLVIIAASQILLAVSTDYSVLLLARGLSGLGDAMIFPSAIRLVMYAVRGSRIALFTQLTGTVGQFGMVVSAFPLLNLVLAQGWATAYAIMAGLSGVIALVVAVVLTVGAPDPTRGAAGQKLKQVLADSWATIRHPGTQLAYWVHFSTAGVVNLFGVTWGVPFLSGALDLSAEEVGAFMFISFLAGVIAGPLIGRFVSLRPHQRLSLVLGSVIFQALAWLSALTWEPPLALVTLLPLMIAQSAGGASSIVAFDLARTSVPKTVVARANGVVNTAGFTASLIGIWAIGWLLSLQGADHPTAYDLEVFRIATLPIWALWAIGVFGIWRANRTLKASQAT
ncbi:MFS transporter [Nesterenkonia alba]|uniref:MFS transporter n=1 Tax=Nesterenkonia alba TaxID=515814 RepID=UPI0003B5AFBF|nr:MFS transporter [Nesterenkonia alba]